MPDEAVLEELLSRPTPPLVEAMARVRGDLVILGAGGKMGPSLARLARRASEAAAVRRTVTAVSRFADAALRGALEADGIATVACDLFERTQVDALPDAANVIYMVGQKFGTSDHPPRTWAVNTVLPALAAERYRAANLVAFSTGNVYPLWPLASAGPAESDPVGPVGEYAQSALARERILEFWSRERGTPMALLRLNYAVEPRYGVLRDIADAVREGRGVALAMGAVNLIWQRDANAIALRMLEHCASPPVVLNVTGRPAHRVRWIAAELGRRLGAEPLFQGVEQPTALLSDAARCEELLGKPETGIAEMLDRVARWVKDGGRSLGKPTGFERREGSF